jgi:6-phosphofructokinase 1
MPIIVRKKGSKYKWDIEAAPLSKIANLEKKLPKSFISKNGMNVTQKAVDYLTPLIQGESHPPYKNGIPLIKEFKLIRTKKKLAKWK